MNTTTKKRGPQGPISDTHKAAMANGRTQGKTVREYLEALRGRKPGRKRTLESVKRQLATAEADLAALREVRNAGSAVIELKLVQRIIDLKAEQEKMHHATPFDLLELKFIEVAKAYGDRKGYSYEAWREVGVSAGVLKVAGITRAKT